jgi:hypothetical protein
MDVVGRIYLSDGTQISCVTGIDDHSRFCVSAQLVARATAHPVCDALLLALQRYGTLASLLMDMARFTLHARICPGHSQHLSDTFSAPMKMGPLSQCHIT